MLYLTSRSELLAPCPTSHHPSLMVSIKTAQFSSRPERPDSRPRSRVLSCRTSTVYDIAEFVTARSAAMTQYHPSPATTHPIAPYTTARSGLCTDRLHQRIRPTARVAPANAI